LIVAAKQNNALQIAALDDAAVRLGLDVGLPLANARAVCPDIEVEDADESADRATLEGIADWCDRFTPLVGIDPPDGLMLDITGCTHLFGGEAALMTALCQVLTTQKFSVSAAIAGTAVCARTLTRHSHGCIVRNGEEATAVAPLPVFALGADLKITQGLRRAGLKTIGDAASRARHEITARFGADFTALLEQVLGQGDAPISPRKPVPDYVVEKRFAEPVATLEVIATALQSLSPILISVMARHGKGARRLEASFFRTDGLVRTIAVEAGHAVMQPAMIERLFAEKLDALDDPLDPGFGFDLIRLAATLTVVAAETQRGFDTTAHEAADVAQLADRLSARLGARRVVRYFPQDTHIPERAALAVPMLQLPSGFAEASWPKRINGEPPLRPLRLFAQPEAIDARLVEAPDKPPTQFKWRRMYHRIIHVEGPERIAMEWWRSHDSMPTRDYFRIQDDTGQRFWLFRDGLYGEVTEPKWFIHGLFA
jgi:protein ImuB